MKCTWCHKEFDSNYESDLPAYHEKCDTEMKDCKVLLRTIFGVKHMILNDERMSIELRLIDVPKLLYEKYHNREASKLTRGQVLNKQLDILNNLPDEQE
jgi:hypothetical protein